MNRVIEQLNATGTAFVQFALPMLIQVSLLIVVVLALDWLLHKRVRAVLRYWLWMLVLVKLVLPTTLAAPTGIAYWIAPRPRKWPRPRKRPSKYPRPKVCSWKWCRHRPRESSFWLAPIYQRLPLKCSCRRSRKLCLPLPPRPLGRPRSRGRA